MVNDRDKVTKNKKGRLLICKSLGHKHENID